MPVKLSHNVLGTVEVHRGYNKGRVGGTYLLVKPFQKSKKVKLYGNLRCKGFITVQSHLGKTKRISVPDENEGYTFHNNPSSWYYEIYNLDDEDLSERLTNRNENYFSYSLICKNHETLYPGSPNSVLFSFGPYKDKPA